MPARTSWFARPSKPHAAPIRVLTAAATRLNLEDRKQAQRQRVMRQGWQSDAWAYRDAIGELRYAINFLANCTARMKLFPAAYPLGGEADSPLPLSEIEGVPDNVMAAANAAMRDLGNGRLAISGLLHALSTNTSVAGECYLVGQQDPATSRVTWNIRSIDEIVIESDQYRLRELPNATQGGDGWITLDPALSVVSRIWTPHPRYQLLADAPLRAIMDDCESLLILRRMIRATGRSRLAGRGLLLVPDELSIKQPTDDNDDPDADPIMRALTEAMMEPIGDEGVASAVVPIVIRGPGETLAKVQHIDFASTFDEQSSRTREELVGIIATGLDIPKEVVSGMADLNHWTAWQVDDNTFRHHVEPHVIGCCDAVTGAYLRPYLEAANVEPEWVQRILYWYDPTELVTHPDQTKDALELHDRLVISDEALRKTAGFPDEDEPSKAEIQVRLLEKMRAWPPNLVMAFLHQWDPSLIAPPITEAGTIPGINPRGVDTGQPAPGAPGVGATPVIEAGPVTPPAPQPQIEGPPPITAAGTGQQTGVMVALFPAAEVAARLALPQGDPPEDLHVTLAYLGDEDELADADPDAIHKTVEAWALGTPAITGEISGVGLFTAGPDPVTYLSVDLPGLPAARETLIAALTAAATATPSDAHGFTPHMTLQYANRVNDVPADIGGTALEFATVAVVIGSERTDYPFAESLVAAGARTRAEQTRLSRKLTAIDADLRARLHTAANAAMLRQLERAGARLRTRVAKDETLRSKIAQRPNELVAGLLGEAVVASIGLTEDDVMGSDWSGLRAQFMEWTAAAQTQAVAAAIRLGSLAEQDEAVVAAQAAMDAGRDSAWETLSTALTGLGHHLLYSPHPSDDPAQWADLNAETLVPTGMLRAALAIAGGASSTDIATDQAGMLTFLPGSPIGQIGTGATITDLLTTAGLATTGYSWEHGPALHPFEPHEALDGVDFATFDDEALANTDGWPDNAYFMPGDHDGCSCDFVALWADQG